jgi:hypothetical protein
MGIKVIKGGILLLTGILLASMITMIEEWQIFVTPISVLGVHPSTRQFFSYLTTLQVLILGVLYHQKKVKPLLSYIGLASLCMLSIYDMEVYNRMHNFFAFLFFFCQPIIFYMEYRKSKDPYNLSKVGVLLFLMLLVWIGVLPLPIFEFISYTLLILFL